MAIHIEERGRKRVTSDDFNPRVYLEEWKCLGCSEWVEESEVTWSLPDGTLNTDKGDPYCDGCYPVVPYDPDEDDSASAPRGAGE